MRRHLLALACATLLLPACGGDDDDDRAAVTSVPVHTTVTTSSTPTTTEAPVPPPDVIPADETQITEQYVEQVLNALYEVSLEAILLTREAGVVDEEVIRRTESTSSPAHARMSLNSLADLAATGFEGFRENPRPVRADVSELLHANAECILADVIFDSSGLVELAPVRPEGAKTFAVLRPASTEQRESGYNPTAWVVDSLPASEDGSVPSDTC